MRMLFLAVAASTVLAGCTASASSPAAPGAAGSADFQHSIELAKQKVYPALVYIKPIQETFRSGERRQAEMVGSGVIITPDGYVVTNNHVAEKAVQVHCVLGDKELIEADVIGLDPETDLALLKLKPRLNGPPLKYPLPYASFGDSDKLDTGQAVLALGAPFGFSRSVSQGIISNTRRYLGFSGRHQYNLWLQTDAAINPGNSGGPLVNTDGQIIGINTLGVSAGGGIGFSVPSNTVQYIIKKLLAAEAEQKGVADVTPVTHSGTGAAAVTSRPTTTSAPARQPVKVDRAWTGLQLQALVDLNTTTITESPDGVLIQSVDKASPAEEAGVRDGDILLSANGAKITGRYAEELPGIRVALSDLPTGKPADLLVRRDGKETHIAVTPVLKGKFEGEDVELRRWNLTVKEITKFSNPRLFFQNPQGGVFVQGTKRPGNAFDAGLRENDILLKIGPYDIKTIEDARKAYQALLDDKSLVEKKTLVMVKRGGFPAWLTLNWTTDYEDE